MNGWILENFALDACWWPSSGWHFFCCIQTMQVLLTTCKSPASIDLQYVIVGKPLISTFNAERFIDHLAQSRWKPRSIKRIAQDETNPIRTSKRKSGQADWATFSPYGTWTKNSQILRTRRTFAPKANWQAPSLLKWRSWKIEGHQAAAAIQFVNSKNPFSNWSGWDDANRSAFTCNKGSNIRAIVSV